MNQEERMYVIDDQKITLDGKTLKGNLILDIGGGGEGIIGLCYGNKVISIDPSKDELKEAADGPLKIAMDARELLFLDNSFDTVTSFFTLMYIGRPDHKKVFSEAYRVLKDDGEFILWDTTISKYDGGLKDVFIVKLEVDTPKKSIKTGYGTLWKDKEQDISYFSSLGKETGFKVMLKEINNQIFKIVFKKLEGC